jgi:hypothetical protein
MLEAQIVMDLLLKLGVRVNWGRHGDFSVRVQAGK